MKDNEAILGSYTTEHQLNVEPNIICADAAAAGQLKQPWVRAEIERQIGVKLPPPNRAVSRKIAKIAMSLFGKHAFYCGATGSGKSRAIFKTYSYYLRFGASVVILEPKLESVKAYISEAKAAGLRPEQIICLSPRLPYIPGFNLFATDLDITQIAADLTDIILGVTGTVGPRMYPFLFNLLCLLAVHKDLSLIDAIYAIQDFAYLERIVSRPVPSGLKPGDALAHDMSVAYFQDFAEASRSEKASTVAPISNRLAEIARSIFWHGGLGSDTCVNMAGFWEHQTVCVVHLDQAELGANGMKLLAGFVSSILYRTAFRATGKRPVFLIVDEAATAEAFLGKALVDILAIGRGLNLSLLVAAQYFEQLSDSLLSGLLSQPAVSLFFRLGHSAANRAAAAFATGHEATLKRVIVARQERSAKGTKPAKAQWTQPIFDGSGRTLSFSARGWQRFLDADLYAVDSLPILSRLAAGSGIASLYVRDAVTDEPIELRRYLAGVNPTDISLAGPAPVRLTIAFQPLTLSGVERSREADRARHIAGILQNLPPRHAALKLAGAPAEIIRVADVPDPPTGTDEQAFFEAVQRANGQSPAEIAARIAARQARVRGRSGAKHQAEVDDDGSL